jgi:hypothetical protein
MPSYINSPFANPYLLMKGVAGYMFGSFDPRIGNTNLVVTKLAGNGTTATVTVLLLNGPMPAVGNFISIFNSTLSAGAFNVSRALITAVTIDAILGTGTIQFASAASLSATVDVGQIIVEPNEVPETLAAGASQAFVIQAPEGDSQFTVPFAATFTAIPTAVTVTLQRAINAQNSAEWTNTTTAVTVAGSAYTAGPVMMATLERGYAYRALVSGLTAGTGSGLIVKIGG